jgi:hypothetical protein
MTRLEQRGAIAFAFHAREGNGASLLNAGHWTRGKVQGT